MVSIHPILRMVCKYTGNLVFLCFLTLTAALLESVAEGIQTQCISSGLMHFDAIQDFPEGPLTRFLLEMSCDEEQQETQ